MNAYIRELDHAERDIFELSMLLNSPAIDLTVQQLAQAIGLASTIHRALLSAMKARDEGLQA